MLIQKIACWLCTGIFQVIYCQDPFHPVLGHRNFAICELFFIPSHCEEMIFPESSTVWKLVLLFVRSSWMFCCPFT